MMGKFQALEKNREIAVALKMLERKFSAGAEKKARMGGDIYWHEKYSCWGCLAKSSPKSRYWIPFGVVNTHHRQNMIVEINPAVSGINTNVQGLVAKDGKGSRWLMHQGRLHPSGVRISQEMFDQIYPKDRVSVSFSSRENVGYHKVACLDGSSGKLIKDLSEYVHSCAEVRKYWVEDAPKSHLEATLRNSERKFSEESHGKSFRPGSEGSVFVRSHGKVVNELADILEGKGYEVDSRRNKRRLGPDLLAYRKNRQSLLFEVKTRLNMNSVYCAVGQLFIYNELEDDYFQRIAVFPTQFDKILENALKSLDIEILTYGIGKGRAIKFKASALKKILRK